jgi:hypothetical protein
VCCLAAASPAHATLLQMFHGSVKTVRTLPAPVAWQLGYTQRPLPTKHQQRPRVAGGGVSVQLHGICSAQIRGLLAALPQHGKRSTALVQTPGPDVPPLCGPLPPLPPQSPAPPQPAAAGGGSGVQAAAAAAYHTAAVARTRERVAACIAPPPAPLGALRGAWAQLEHLLVQCSKKQFDAVGRRDQRVFQSSMSNMVI